MIHLIYLIQMIDWDMRIDNPQYIALRNHLEKPYVTQNLAVPVLHGQLHLILSVNFVVALNQIQQL